MNSGIVRWSRRPVGISAVEADRLAWLGEAASKENPVLHRTDGEQRAGRRLRAALRRMEGRQWCLLCGSHCCGCPSSEEGR